MSKSIKCIKSLLKRMIPERYHSLAVYTYITIFYFGLRHKCPCCGGHFRKFLPFGIKVRANALCPRCGSLERHRLLWIYLKERTNILTGYLKVLYIAPQPCMWEKFKKIKNCFPISADISSPTAMVKMDITNIPMPDNQFDCIICYHVLEHIPDDKKAMLELFRVLKPGGWSLHHVPIDYSRKETFEDPKIISPVQRERVFGQQDHVRIYGRDFKDRLKKAGFTVKPVNYVKELGEKKIIRYGLRKDESEIIYFCAKPN